MSEDKEETEKQKIIKTKNKKKNRLRGFPSMIWNQLKGLNESIYFKRNYGDHHYDLLLICTDDRRAALIHVKDGNISVEQFKNKPEIIKPLKKKADARIKTDTETFIEFGMGKVKPIPAILKGKLKIRGVSKILKFMKYFAVLRHEERNRTKSK